MRNRAIEEIKTAVAEMEEDRIGNMIDAVMKRADHTVFEVYRDGLHAGMTVAIGRYADKTYDIPQLIVCADTMNKGLRRLETYGKVYPQSKGKVLLAVVAGDTHEIGKNIVKIMVEAGGYEVLDFGVNRSADEILQEAQKQKVDVIGLSSMMSTTRGEMKVLIDLLDEKSVSPKPFVIVGGGSISDRYAREIGADGYAPNAAETIRLLDALLGGEVHDASGVH